MKVWQKFSNIYRLNRRSRQVVVSYLINKLLQKEVKEDEKGIYQLYNYLICLDGFLEEELENTVTIVFKNKNLKLVLRKHPSSDFLVFEQVFFWREYFSVLELFTKFFSRECNNQLNIIDCGSNIGLTSIFFLSYYPNSKVIALEPETRNFNQLVINFNHGNWPNAIPVNAAVWSENSKIRVLRDFRDKGDWSFRVLETEDPHFTNALSIKSIMEQYEMSYLDILKIDIEGSEKELFTSPKANLSFLHKTRCIAIEIHDEFNCRQEIYQILENFGFHLSQSGELTIGYNRSMI